MYSGAPHRILEYPNETLKLVSRPILDSINQINFLADMEATVKYNNALGVSAVQLGVPIRALTILANNNKCITMVNPHIVKQSSGNTSEKEGCLSFPELYVPVTRSTSVEVSFYDTFGNYENRLLEAREARIFLHELDHLNGVLMIDHLSKYAKESALNKYRIAQRRAQR
jgi:peptide deformylase